MVLCCCVDAGLIGSELRTGDRADALDASRDAARFTGDVATRTDSAIADRTPVPEASVGMDAAVRDAADVTTPRDASPEASRHASEAGLDATSDGGCALHTSSHLHEMEG